MKGEYEKQEEEMSEEETLKHETTRDNKVTRMAMTAGPPPLGKSSRRAAESAAGDDDDDGSDDNDSATSSDGQSTKPKSHTPAPKRKRGTSDEDSEEDSSQYVFENQKLLKHSHDSRAHLYRIRINPSTPVTHDFLLAFCSRILMIARKCWMSCSKSKPSFAMSRRSWRTWIFKFHNSKYA